MNTVIKGRKLNSLEEAFEADIIPFEVDLIQLLEDIAKNIRATEPAELKKTKLIYGYRILKYDDGVQGYEGYIKRKRLYFPGDLLASFDTTEPGNYIGFRIYDKSISEPVSKALENHKDKFGNVYIEHGPESYYEAFMKQISRKLESAKVKVLAVKAFALKIF